MSLFNSEYDESIRQATQVHKEWVAWKEKFFVLGGLVVKACEIIAIRPTIVAEDRNITQHDITCRDGTIFMIYTTHDDQPSAEKVIPFVTRAELNKVLNEFRQRARPGFLSEVAGYFKRATDN